MTTGSHDMQSILNTALMKFLEQSPIPSFVINDQRVVVLWNKACEKLTGIAAPEMLGKSEHWRALYSEPRPLLVDLIVEGGGTDRFHTYYADSTISTSAGTYSVERYFPEFGANGLWLLASASPVHDDGGRVIGAIEILQDIQSQKCTEAELQKGQPDLERLVAKRTAQLARANEQLEEDIRRREAVEAELLRRNGELIELNEKFSAAQEQLIQSDKLASIGQLAAGVAHEINNPIGYIFSNFGALQNYIESLLDVLLAYERAEDHITSPEARTKIAAVREQAEIDYVKEDMPVLLRESKEGIVRVRKIVQDLKDFSHVDAHQEWQWADIHQGIDSTLNIVSNEVKYKADVIKEYGDIPEVECLASQINQVVMNLVVNASHAITGARGKITIRTGSEGQHVWIEIADNGSGIPKETLSRIFDPFFTTKPVGSGTGLGLSLSYGIVQKHQGRIEVESEPGVGTCFRVTLPVRHQFEVKSV